MLNWRHLFAEVYGTFVLNFGVCAAFGENFSVGPALFIAIVSSGMVSGAHFNPAVTTSIMLVGAIKKEISKADVIKYFAYYVAQIVGGILGGLVAWGVIGKTFHMVIKDPYSTDQGFVGEMFVTGALCMTAQMQGELKNSGLVGPLVIGLVIFFGATVVGPISSGCFNPAVGIGALFNDAWNHNDAHRMKHLWIYIFAPLLGGAIAAIIFVILVDEVRAQQGTNKVRKSERESQRMSNRASSLLSVNDDFS